MNRIEWAHPWVLWLVLAVLAVWGLRVWWGFAIRSAQRRIGSQDARCLRNHAQVKTWVRSICLWTGVIMGLIALAGPRWGQAQAERVASGQDIMVAIDCSNSMRAEDLYPTRSGAAHRKIRDLMEMAPGLRIGLVPFAGTAVPLNPLTGDHGAVTTQLEQCIPDLFPTDYQGSSMAAAVESGLSALQGSGDRSRAMLLLTDGDDPDQDAVRKAADRARAEGIPLYGLLMADPDAKTTLKHLGRDIPVEPKSTTLQTLSERSGGIFAVATNDESDLALLLNHIETHLQRVQWVERQRMQGQERYQGVLLAGILLLLVGGLMGTRRWGNH